MPADFNPVSPGDDVSGRLTSSRWINGVTAAAFGGELPALAGGGGDVARLPVECLIKNTTTVDVARYGILGVDGPLYDKTANANYFLGRILQFKGVKPKAEHAGRTAHALDTIKAGKIGRAIIPCAVQCQVDITAAADRFASIVDDDVAKLKSGATGNYPIVPAETGTGVKWAIVFLAPTPGGMLRVLLTGSAAAASYSGGVFTPATFTARVLRKSGATYTHSASDTMTCTNPFTTAVNVTAGKCRTAWVQTNGELVVADCTEQTL